MLIHVFKAGPDGAYPVTLMAAPGGVFYGTTQPFFTPNTPGTVFVLEPPKATGTPWTKKVLASFPLTLSPVGDLLRDASGTIYGVADPTYLANTNDYGEVFRLRPPTADQPKWILSTLHAFPGFDGKYASGGLVQDANGALYGSRMSGGAFKNGNVFKLTPPASGHGDWSETKLYSFTGYLDGLSPMGGLVIDSAGSLFGQTIYGGDNELAGAVFKLSPPAAGKVKWTESVIHSFSGPDGSEPMNGLLMDRTGALYGTTSQGGNDTGNVFKLTPPSSGHGVWTETVLYTFTGGYDGLFPECKLSQDSQGFIYGTTPTDGGFYGAGTVFRLDPPVGARHTWQLAVLHTFRGQRYENATDSYYPTPLDGADPLTPPIPVRDAGGAIHLFGVTLSGGKPNEGYNEGTGVVYEVVP